MSKEMEELMQKTIISENIALSEMINDIIPKPAQRFTDLELEANKKQEFSVVIYKKENILKRLFKNLKFSLEKFRIMRHSQEFDYIKNKTK